MKIRSHRSRRSKGANLSSASLPLPKRLNPLLGLLRVTAETHGHGEEVIEIHRDHADKAQPFSVSIPIFNMDRVTQGDPAFRTRIAKKKNRNAIPALVGIALGLMARTRNARVMSVRDSVLSVASSTPPSVEAARRSHELRLHLKTNDQTSVRQGQGSCVSVRVRRGQRLGVVQMCS